MRQRWCECISAGRVSELICGAQRNFLGVRFWPRLCENYFRILNVVFHDHFMAVFVG